MKTNPTGPATRQSKELSRGIVYMWNPNIVRCGGALREHSREEGKSYLFLFDMQGALY
jgi:hypothetical protein